MTTLQQLKSKPSKSCRNYFHIQVASNISLEDFKALIDSIIESHGKEELLTLMKAPDDRDITPIISIFLFPEKLLYVINKLEDHAETLFQSQYDIIHLKRLESSENGITLLDKIWDTIAKAKHINSKQKNELQSCMISIIVYNLRYDREDYTKCFVNKVLRDNRAMELKYLPLLLPLLKQYSQDDDVVKYCVMKCQNEASLWYRIKLFFNGYCKLAINWNKLTSHTVAPLPAEKRSTSNPPSPVFASDYNSPTHTHGIKA